MNVRTAAQNAARILAKQQLYVLDRSSPGSIFFLPHGARVFNKLMQFMRHQQLRHGFQEVVTPLIYKTELWRKSGHWDKYRDDMFAVTSAAPPTPEAAPESAPEPSLSCADISNAAMGPGAGPAGASDGASDTANGAGETYGLKPMNCPGHCVLYLHLPHSYADLPVRYSDFSSLHRNEASGALAGLTRLRRFHQDDGHIFCTAGQIDLEIRSTLALIRSTYAVFGLPAVRFSLSTRPESYIGDLDTWNAAEKTLRDILDQTEPEWSLKPGDGAFYGPKIDVMVTDGLGKTHQIGTVQLDFNLPQRFLLEYVGPDGTGHRPIMIHRAVFGSIERFLGILIDHYQGKWPFWMNPRQCLVVPVSEKHAAYAHDVQRRLSGDIVAPAPAAATSGGSPASASASASSSTGTSAVAPLVGEHYDVDVDTRSEPVGLRVREAVAKGYSYIVLVGDKEAELQTVAVRTRDSRKVTGMAVDELYRQFQADVAAYR